MAFSAEAKSELRQIVTEVVKEVFGDITITDLGNLLSHGQLPTDPAGAPSRVGLDQLDAQVATVIEALGVLPDIEAQLEQIRAMLMGGASSGGKLVLMFVPDPAPAPLSQLPLPSSGTPIAFDPSPLLGGGVLGAEPAQPVDQQPGAPA